jgi:hypothetical protein
MTSSGSTWQARLYKPDVRISRIRLSDWLHRRQTGPVTRASSVSYTALAPRQSLLERLLVSCGDSQAYANSPTLAFFASIPEVRVLPSTGGTRPQQHYDPGIPRRYGIPFGLCRASSTRRPGLVRNTEGRFYLAELMGAWNYGYQHDGAVGADIVNFRKVRVGEVGVGDTVPGKVIACFRL